MVRTRPRVRTADLGKFLHLTAEKQMQSREGPAQGHAAGPGESVGGSLVNGADDF